MTIAWNENYDVPSVGIYDKQGKVYLDRTAARVLTLDEKWRIYNHEIAEFNLRKGKMIPYSVAHEEALKAVSWTPELKEKIQRIATSIQQARPQTPPNVMFAGAISLVGTSSISRPVALEYAMRCYNGHLWGFGEKVFKIGAKYYCPIDGGILR